MIDKDEWDIWQRIKVLQVLDDGTIKCIGERVLEDDRYEVRIVKSIFEDKRFENGNNVLRMENGDYYILRGFYAQHFRNGIYVDTDLQGNEYLVIGGRYPDIIYMGYAIALAKEYSLFMRGDESEL